MTPALKAGNWEVLPLKAHFRGEHNCANGSTYPRAMLRVAVGYRRQLESEHRRVVGIAHSMGCITLLIAALLMPKKFKALVLVAPAGFLEHDNLLALAARGALKTVFSLAIAVRHPSLLRATLAQERANLVYGFSWRTLQEIFCLPGIITESWIVRLREQGVEVYAIFGGRDRIYPLARVKWMARHLNGYRIIPGGPHDLQLKAALLVTEIAFLLSGASTAPGGDVALYAESPRGLRVSGFMRDAILSANS